MQAIATTSPHVSWFYKIQKALFLAIFCYFSRLQSLCSLFFHGFWLSKREIGLSASHLQMNTPKFLVLWTLTNLHKLNILMCLLACKEVSCSSTVDSLIIETKNKFGYHKVFHVEFWRWPPSKLPIINSNQYRWKGKISPWTTPSLVFRWKVKNEARIK